MFCWLKKPKSLLSKSCKHYKEIRERLTKNEIRMLEKIYMDLAGRRSDCLLSLENFLLFFDLNVLIRPKQGFWGQKLFQQFDLADNQLLTFELFLMGIAKMGKNSECDRVLLLYNHFRKESEGLTYKSFIKMLYSYPKPHLKHILNDEEFLTNEILLKSESSQEDRHRNEKPPHELRYASLDKIIEVDYRCSRETKDGEEPQESHFKQAFKNILQHKDEGTSIYFDLENKMFCVREVNINTLVKIFASRIYEHYHIDKAKGSLSFEQFRQWIQQHPKLYDSYFKGLHNYIWEYCDGISLLRKNKFEKKSINVKYITADNKEKHVTAMLVNTTLVLSTDENGETPLEIVCLDGLTVLPVDNSLGAGIQITHKNGVYPTKILYFSKKSEQQEWAETLKTFKGVSVQKLYSILDRLGTGNFSIVYRSVQKSSGDEYAMKIIETKSLTENSKKNIIHQINIMKVMNNLRIINFKEHFETKTHLYIVTQLVRGVDLFEYVVEKNSLNEYDAALIAGQIIEAVQYIHALGVVHRDLKPENIMVVEETQKDLTADSHPKIKIIDFGLSNYVDILQKTTKEGSRFYYSETLVGTPNYIAPQIIRRQSLSEKADTFAIGVIIYFMLSGDLPFNSSDCKTIFDNTVECKLNFAGYHWQIISKDAKDLISRMLTRGPAQRISLEQSLNHVWFSKRNQKEKKTLSKRGSVGPLLF